MKDIQIGHLMFEDGETFDVSTFADDIKNLKEAVPQTYLAKIIKRANAIEAGTEVLILAEELTEA